MNPNDIKFEVIKKLAEVKFKYREFRRVSEIDTISPPSVFIGSKLKYPLMNVGILSPIERDENAWVYDAEKYWAENNFGISEVLNLRQSLLNSRFQSQAKDARLNKKFLELAKEIAIASKPVDVEIKLKDNFNTQKIQDKVLTGHGMHASLKDAKIVSNVKVSQRLDKMMNDEIKACEAMKILYNHNLSEYNLSKILSVGVLGLKKNKRLVPTRWSITATDDVLGKQILEGVKSYSLLDSYELFFGEFLGNQYVILLFPFIWSFELFEFYLPGSSWNPSLGIKASTDFEDFYGRKNYASSTTGGYYATRLSVLEYLKKIKKQAGVLVLRIETPTYWAGLGVWVVRESVRKAISRGRILFDSREELLNSATQISKVKYKFDNSGILKQSKLLNQIKTQKNLREWF